MWRCYGRYNGKSLKGFFAYVQAKIEQYYETLTYRVYTTDALSAIVNNVRNVAGGSEIKARWYELVSGKTEKEIETNTKSAEEIALEVIKKAGLKVAYYEPI